MAGKLWRGLKPVLLGVRGVFLLATDTALRLVPRGPSGARRRVLIVRLDRIGDFLLWLDAVRALRRVYPADQYELTLMGHPSWTSLAQEAGVFDQVWPLDQRRFVWSLRYRWAQLRRIRRAGFSTVVQARYSRELFVEDAVTRASSTPERIGFGLSMSRETRCQKAVSDRWYTRLVAPETGPRMELEHNARLVRALGLTHFRAGVPSLSVSEPLPDALAGRDYFVLFPGASWSGKQWPVENFCALAERLHRRTGWAGVVCGGPDEAALGATLAAQADAPLQNWAGRTTLTQLAAIIAGARIVVSNDTSGVHMAAAVDTPSVCILGGGHYGRFLPYRVENGGGRALPLPVITPMDCFGCGWHCIYPVAPGRPTPCVGNVTLDSVWESVQSVLDGACARAAGDTGVEVVV